MSNYDIALEVLTGKWGNGAERRSKLAAAGYDYQAVQSIVNSLVKDGALKKEPEQTPEPETHRNLLEIDYDPEINDGIQINVLI